jgi:hypothetical protein
MDLFSKLKGGKKKDIEKKKSFLFPYKCTIDNKDKYIENLQTLLDEFGDKIS